MERGEVFDGCVMDSTWREPCGKPTVSDVPGEPGYPWCSEHLPVSESICAENPRFDGQPWEPWEGNGPCRDCGARNVIWATNSDLWQRVMGAESGIVICPSCFIKRAFSAGVDDAWRIEPWHGVEGV